MHTSPRYKLQTISLRALHLRGHKGHDVFLLIYYLVEINIDALWLITGKSVRFRRQLLTLRLLLLSSLLLVLASLLCRLRGSAIDLRRILNYACAATPLASLLHVQNIWNQTIYRTVHILALVQIYPLALHLIPLQHILPHVFKSLQLHSLLSNVLLQIQHPLLFLEEVIPLLANYVLVKHNALFT